MAIDNHGTPLPQATIDACLEADSVLLGAVGGPKWDGVPGDKRPEKGLLGIRLSLIHIFRTELRDEHKSKQRRTDGLENKGDLHNELQQRPGLRCV